MRRAVPAATSPVDGTTTWHHQPWAAVLACRGRPRVAAEYAKLVGMHTSCRGKGLHGTVAEGR